MSFGLENLFSKVEIKTFGDYFENSVYKPFNRCTPFFVFERYEKQTFDKVNEIFDKVKQRLHLFNEAKRNFKYKFFATLSFDLYCANAEKKNEVISYEPEEVLSLSLQEEVEKEIWRLLKKYEILEMLSRFKIEFRLNITEDEAYLLENLPDAIKTLTITNAFFLEVSAKINKVF